MANKNDKNNIKDERIEDVTMYGEFISSFHQWVTPDRQRQIARHLAEVAEERAPGAAGRDNAGKDAAEKNIKRSN